MWSSAIAIATRSRALRSSSRSLFVISRSSFVDSSRKDHGSERGALLPFFFAAWLVESPSARVGLVSLGSRPRSLARMDSTFSEHARSVLAI